MGTFSLVVLLCRIYQEVKVKGQYICCFLFIDLLLFKLNFDEIENHQYWLIELLCRKIVLQLYSKGLIAGGRIFIYFARMTWYFNYEC